MKNIPKRTIESVLDIETGKELVAKDFFNQPEEFIYKIRYQLEEAIQSDKAKYVCYFCKQKVKIRGGGEEKRILHFAHLKDSDDCHIKTESKFTKEEIEQIKYNGAKESPLHVYLKNFIGSQLMLNEKDNKGASDVKVDKVYKDVAISKDYRKPDVSADYIGKHIVLEIQLSTTFLSTIVKRERFYKERRNFVVWIFHEFDTNADLQKFTQKDVIYANKQNAFVLDRDLTPENSAISD